MKRYKLLKDLAGLKAGSTLYLNELGNLVADDETTIVFLANFIHHYSLLDSDWLEEIPEEYKRWRGWFGDTYYLVTDALSVDEETEQGCALDERLYATGNYFKTREEAQKAANWLKAFAVLRDDTKGFKPDWEDINQDKWYVLYNHSKKELTTSLIWTQQGEALYFASIGDADASIKNHKCEWLAYFNCGGGNE